MEEEGEGIGMQDTGETPEGGEVVSRHSKMVGKNSQPGCDG